MAPAKKSREQRGNQDGGGVSGGSRRRGGRQEEDEDNDDDALLDAAKTGRWTDSFIMLCVASWFIRWAWSFLRRSKATANDSTDGAASGASVKAKRSSSKSEEETLSLKEAALQHIRLNKIPVLLISVFVLTCALIIGGERLGEQNDGKKEVADDFYGVLGISRDAETADVKRAYKTLAKRWHPDKNPNCTTCQDTFSKIAIAMETLVDNKKRAAYDESGDIATKELKSPRSVPLTRDNFDQLVTFSNDVWMVQIFKPNDPNSASFHAFWEHQIQKHGNLVRFGRVDLTNDLGKWLPVKIRVLPMLLKFRRDLGSPEIFPLTAMHETASLLTKFVLTSFPNIGLPLDRDAASLSNWLRGSGRRHKVLLAIPGKSEEERYKSHLVPRKLASQWSELFEFRTVEAAAVHRLGPEHLPDEVRSQLPPKNESSNKAALLFFTATGDVVPKASAVLTWPISEDEIVLQLLDFVELAAPALSARSADLICRSLAIRRVYCLVLIDPAETDTARAVHELKDSRSHYALEVAQIREEGGDIAEDEDNFVVPAVRLFRRPRGLQPAIATCRAPRFEPLEQALDGANAFLMDFDTGRIAALKGLTSYRSVYPMIAYEDDLTWVDNALHPFLSLPDCDEDLVRHLIRGLRAAPAWEIVLQFFTAIFLMEAFAKSIMERSVKWGVGAGSLLLLVFLRSPPFLRGAAAYLPGSFFAPPLLTS